MVARSFSNQEDRLKDKIDKQHNTLRAILLCVTYPSRVSTLMNCAWLPTARRGAAECTAAAVIAVEDWPAKVSRVRTCSEK